MFPACPTGGVACTGDGREVSKNYGFPLVKVRSSVE